MWYGFSKNRCALLNQRGEYKKERKMHEQKLIHRLASLHTQLLEQYQDLVTAVDDNGNSLLHVACQNNHRRVVKLLLKLGVHMDSQNKGGNTPLHYCYAYQFVQLADILLQSGADATIVNAAGLIPSMGIEKEGVPE